MAPEEAIRIIEVAKCECEWNAPLEYQEAFDAAIEALKAQPETSTEIQEILNYLDTTLHPIVSPDNWYVYAELHDMVSMLPSAQPEHSPNTPQKQPDLETLGIKTGETCADVISRRAAIDALMDWVEKEEKKSWSTFKGLFHWTGIKAMIECLPSAQSKQLQVLANVLDGCPLTQPCDKMWRGGWCEEHCKNNKLQEPDAECWLKYAEVMAADDT